MRVRYVGSSSMVNGKTEGANRNNSSILWLIIASSQISHHLKLAVYLTPVYASFSIQSILIFFNHEDFLANDS